MRGKRLAAVILAVVFALMALLGCAKAQDEGAKFTLTVVYEDKSERDYTLDAGGTIADAMKSAALISEDEFKSGLVTEIDGAKADYEADGAWWALCDADGNMTSVGIRDIRPKAGDVYKFIYQAQ